MKRKRISVLVKLIIAASNLFILSCGQLEKEYYDNGELKFEAQIKNGKRHGESVEYYESGEVKIVGSWVNGKRNGKTVVYYKDGVLKQESYYSNGTICCIAKLYREDKTLQEIQYFNENGQMIDFRKISRNGKQNTDIATRKAIFVPISDTVNLGDYYEAEIRLGNRRFDDIKVISGDLDDEELINKQPLPMKDSITAFFRIKGEKVGENFAEGVIIETNVNYQDSLLVVPFRRPFYVRERSRLNI